MSVNQAASTGAKLPESERMALALRGLRRSESITGLAAELGVSRKFA